MGLIGLVLLIELMRKFTLKKSQDLNISAPEDDLSSNTKRVEHTSSDKENCHENGTLQRLRT